MSALSFLLCLPPAGSLPDALLWSGMDSLDAAAGAGDEVVIAEAGPQPLAARFADMGGWPGGVRRIALDAATPPHLLAAAAARAAAHPALLVAPGALIRPAGLAALRAALSDGADLCLLTEGWRLPGLDTALPHDGPGRADPGRLVPFTAPPEPGPLAAAAHVDVRLAGGAARPCPAPATLAPRPPSRAIAFLAAASGGARVPADRVAAELPLVDPAETEDLLAALDGAADALDGLPQDGPLPRLVAASRAGDRAAALAELALVFARRDHVERAALADGLARLRADLDLALPGEAYLRDTYEVLRRPRRPGD